MLLTWMSLYTLKKVEGRKSTYITEGNLRASHRALSQAPYNNLGLPFHPITKAIWRRFRPESRSSWSSTCCRYRTSFARVTASGSPSPLPMLTTLKRRLWTRFRRSAYKGTLPMLHSSSFRLSPVIRELSTKYPPRIYGAGT